MWLAILQDVVMVGGACLLLYVLKKDVERNEGDYTGESGRAA